MDTATDVLPPDSSIRAWSHEFGLACIAAGHERWLRDRLKGARVLDAGCGDGRLLGLLARGGATAIGLDLSRAALERVSPAVRRQAALVQGSVLNMPFPDGCFDLVCTSEVLEHVAEPEHYLQELFRVLRPGGLCTLSTPNGLMFYAPWPWNWRRLLRAAIRPGRYSADMAPEYDWVRALPAHPAIRPSLLHRWCRAAGFSVLRHRGLLWSYYTPERYCLETLCRKLEQIGVPTRSSFTRFVTGVEALLAHLRPLAFWMTTRQVVLLQKHGPDNLETPP